MVIVFINSSYWIESAHASDTQEKNIVKRSSLEKLYDISIPEGPSPS